ncbi:hypothetical protein [Pontibacter chitinilyticus]|uniref:hypothetical protein n=1 Tax=Pontibacter chitinilyticus TaxID=2674989 RepID=UPI00321B433A
MKKVLKRFHEPFRAEIKHPQTRVIEFIVNEKLKKRGLFDFLSSSPIDFREITISNGSLIIDVKPKMLNPFRGMGKIFIKLEKDDNSSWTKVEGEIVPYNNRYILTVFLFLSFLTVWTAFAFIIDTSINTYIVVALGWTMFTFILYMLPFWYRSRLREYKDSFLLILNSKTLK